MACVLRVRRCHSRAPSFASNYFQSLHRLCLIPFQSCLSLARILKSSSGNCPFENENIYSWSNSAHSTHFGKALCRVYHIAIAAYQRSKYFDALHRLTSFPSNYTSMTRKLAFRSRCISLSLAISYIIFPAQLKRYPFLVNFVVTLAAALIQIAIAATSFGCHHTQFVVITIGTKWHGFTTWMCRTHLVPQRV